MKFIHSADIHLGSPIENFPEEKSVVLRRDVITSFLGMIDHAKSNGIKTIVLAGDVFDSNVPFERDKNIFLSAVSANPEIDFLYLRGNHDNGSQSDIPNLHTFSSDPKTYEIEGVNFCGVELSEDNVNDFYDKLSFPQRGKNVLILHGEISSFASENKISIKRLADRNVDYLALGHIHSFYQGKIDDRGIYVNPGCLQGRGFDECGEKHFVVVDSEDFSFELVDSSVRVIRDIEVELSDISGEYAAIEAVKDQIKYPKKDILSIRFTGSVTFDSTDLSALCENVMKDHFFVKVSDKTVRKIDINDYLGDISLKGEFVRCVLRDESLSEEDKSKIINVGLNYLTR